MEEKKLLDVVASADMSYLFPLFRRLLGYDPFVKFYNPNPDTIVLCKRISEEMGFELDESFVEFMLYTNGGFLHIVDFFSFKNIDDKMKDLLYVNLDKNVHDSLVKFDTAFIVGKFSNDYYCYDKKCNIEKTKSKAYVWALYDSAKKEYVYSFDNFYSLLEYHINLLSYSF